MMEKAKEKEKDKSKMKTTLKKNYDSRASVCLLCLKSKKYYHLRDNFYYTKYRHFERNHKGNYSKDFIEKSIMLISDNRAKKLIEDSAFKCEPKKRPVLGSKVSEIDYTSISSESLSEQSSEIQEVELIQQVDKTRELSAIEHDPPSCKYKENQEIQETMSPIAPIEVCQENEDMEIFVPECLEDSVSIERNLQSETPQGAQKLQDQDIHQEGSLTLTVPIEIQIHLYPLKK